MQHMDIGFRKPALGIGITETKTLPPPPWPALPAIVSSRFEVEVVFQTGEKDKVEHVGQKIKSTFLESEKTIRNTLAFL